MTLPCAYIFECLIYLQINFSIFTWHKIKGSNNLRSKNNITSQRNSNVYTKNTIYASWKLHNKLPDILKQEGSQMFRIKIKVIHWARPFTPHINFWKKISKLKSSILRPFLFLIFLFIFFLFVLFWYLFDFIVYFCIIFICPLLLIVMDTNLFIYLFSSCRSTNSIRLSKIMPTGPTFTNL